eukprot:6179261-Prorocentrum_lima.AAC.1
MVNPNVELQRLEDKRCSNIKCVAHVSCLIYQNGPCHFMWTVPSSLIVTGPLQPEGSLLPGH